MPAAIVAGERMQLVDDDGLDVLEEHARIRAARHEHHLDRLGRGQQQIGTIAQDRPPPGRADIAVPEIDAPSDQVAVGPETRFDVVQEGLERTDVEHAQPAPLFGEHPRQERKHRGLGLAAGGGRQHQGVVAVQHGADGLLLERPKRRPAERG